MSNYAASIWATGQSVLNAKYNTAEQRRQLPTVMGLALKNQDYSIPNAQDLRVSPLRPVDVYFFNNVAPGSATAKAYNHTGTYGDTSKVNVVYVSVVETLTLYEKLYANNFIAMQTAFTNLYEQKWKNLRTRQDNAALAYLYTNRTQISAAAMNPQIASANPGTYNGSTFALEIDQTNKQMFAQRIRSYMDSRYFTGELDVIADLQKTADFTFQMQQGGGNFQNTAYQFAGMNIATTQQQIDANYSNGSVIALPKGFFAGLNWNEELNRKGLKQDIGGPVGTFGTASDPFGSGAIADISMYTQRADSSSFGGSTEDVAHQYELTLTIGYILGPLTTASDSVAHEIAQV